MALKTQQNFFAPLAIDGIFIGNDVSATGTMNYLKKIGIQIPEEVKVVGCGNRPISASIEPSLTTNQPDFF